MTQMSNQRESHGDHTTTTLPNQPANTSRLEMLEAQLSNLKRQEKLEDEKIKTEMIKQKQQKVKKVNFSHNQIFTVS